MTNYLTTSAWKTFWKNMRLLSLGPEIFCTSLHVVFISQAPLSNRMSGQMAAWYLSKK